jgi:ATP-dependent DNA ligase
MSLSYNDLRRCVRHTVTFEACLPRKAKELPNGSAWIHEIKHDGFRILAQKDATRVRLITRNGYDFADRYPLMWTPSSGYLSSPA